MEIQNPELYIPNNSKSDFEVFLGTCTKAFLNSSDYVLGSIKVRIKEAITFEPRTLNQKPLSLGLLYFLSLREASRGSHPNRILWFVNCFAPFGCSQSAKLQASIENSSFHRLLKAIAPMLSRDFSQFFQKKAPLQC